MFRRQAKRPALMCGAAILAVAALSGAAHAEAQTVTIPAQSLDSALNAFGVQSGHPVMFKPDLAAGKQSNGARLEGDPESALKELLAGTGLTYRRNGAMYLIVAAESRRAPVVKVQPVIAAETVSGSAVEGLVVTAQKRREQIQDVPIAISAFSADALQAQKIEGGFDLLKAIPNVTFSKNNFSGYNFSIRGIGTKAISVATDPGVAVAFNSTPLLRNRLFEQEYFDVERVEVLRGPQGTLYGRNATAGVINVITQKPELDSFDGTLKGEVGNYHTKRLSGFVNVPIIEDVLGVRFAGALTNREGYDYNATTQHAVNGRDLWSGRLSIGFQPTERIRADFIWERFNEDDDRSRTGKQLCHRDDGPESVLEFTNLDPLARGVMSQGCKPGNLYDRAAFGTPNGLSNPFVQLMAAGFGDVFGRTIIGFGASPANPDGSWNAENYNTLIRPLAPVDPYGGMMQAPDLRVINSLKDPVYRASTDIFALNVDFDITDNLTITSQTAYSDDQVYSFQDYNRFNTVPIFNNTMGMRSYEYVGGFGYVDAPSPYQLLAPGGYYCDPQLGCSNTLAGFDISRARSKQFSQEFRIQSNYDGPFNFSGGVNYLQFSTLEDYFVMYNLLTMAAETFFNGSYDEQCRNPLLSTKCVYVDPNPVESINGEGHNYFRSMNPYRVKSTSAFGEVYWQATDTLKATFGLRYTDDRKTFTPVPTQTLLVDSPLGAGTVDRGYPALPDIKQHWGEVTGRVGVDWKPDVSFTDETLLYAFFSRGYKGGGANPPGIGFATTPSYPGGPPIAETLPFPTTFEPEFVNAYEVGTKNTLLGGGLIFNATAFYYDYKDYQVSKIVDRSAANENFDATVWGLEFESIFMPTPDLRINASLGYQDTKIAKGETSLDLMDRTQGNPDWTVVKPFVQLASNCVAPTSRIAALIERNRSVGWTGPDEGLGLIQLCGGSWLSIDQEYNSFRDGPNFGQGFFADLGGNELPNAPHFTISAGAEYGWDVLDGNWRATVRGDAYWQSQSWARVYNSDPYDKLHGWYNTNLSFWLEKPESDLKLEFYVKNVLDSTPITDAFLNSDDTSLTTNVFVLDPRLIGLQITKGF